MAVKDENKGGQNPKPSSKHKVMWKGGLMHFIRIHRRGYIYGRWTNRFIDLMIHRIFPRIGSRGKTFLADRYHGKLLPQEHAEAVITLNKNIPLQDLEQIVPYPMARDLMLKGSPEILAYECACRHSRKNPCQPTQVCMIIGQPFVGLFHKHNPENSRIISQEEGLQLLRDEHDRGHMHVAWFRTGMMDRFYAICNCCKCCCGGLEAMTKYDIPMLASSGYAAQVDEEKCVGCGKCIEPCPFDAITVKDGRATIDWEKCMGCGVCASQCPEEALSLVLDPKKGEPMDVREM